MNEREQCAHKHEVCVAQHRYHAALKKKNVGRTKKILARAERDTRAIVKLSILSCDISHSEDELFDSIVVPSYDYLCKVE